jgi:rhodanese-related sulfurtransferase
MGLFSFLFGGNNIKEALQKGALVVDVRTPQEFDGGRVPESINIPVDRISSQADRLIAMKRPVVFCCASGARSHIAVTILKAKGKKDVYNGGSWKKVYEIIQHL